MPENFTPEGDGGNSFDEFLARYLAGERARAARSIDISRYLSRRAQEILVEAGRFALEHGHRELDALHILRVMAAEDPAADAMRRIGVDPAKVALAAEERLPQSDSAVDVDSASITPAAQRALFHAYQVARASGSTYIDPEHLFFALVIVQDSPAGQVLHAAGVTAEALTSIVREPATVGADGATAEGAASSASETPMLDQFGTDLTELAREGKLDPVIGRLDEIEQTVEILSRRTKNNPVLVGEAGVGKTAIVEGLARAVADGSVPEQLRDKRVIALDLPAMLAGTRYRGDFEERLTKLMDEISARRDEPHRLHRRAAHGRRRRRFRRGRHGCGKHPEAPPRPRRPAPGRCDHAEGVPPDREGPRPRAPVPAGHGRRAQHRGRRADPVGSAQRVRAAPRCDVHG